MTSNHPDRTFWKDETEAIGNLTTTDAKQDAVHYEKAIVHDEPDLKLVAAPFEEKTDEEKKLVRKIDWYLMPTIWVLYCFSYMVRTNNIYGTVRTHINLGPYCNRKRQSRRHG
jgi:hypothetical protein